MEGTIGRMHKVVSFNGREWDTRPHEPGEPARHTSELSDEAGFKQSRANLWRYEAGAKGRRHVHADQEETFLVLAGAMTMYVGELAEPARVSVGELIHVSPGPHCRSSTMAPAICSSTSTARRRTKAPRSSPTQSERCRSPPHRISTTTRCCGTS